MLRAYGRRETGAERRLARRVLATARLNNLPQDDLVDVLGTAAGTLDRRLHGEGAELWGAKRRQRTE